MFLESTIFESWFVKCTEKKIIGVENALGNLNCLFQDPYPESSIYWGLRWSPDIWNFNQIAEAILLSLGLLFRNTAVEAKTWIEEKLLLTTHSFLQHCSLWYSFFPSSDHSYFIFLVFLLTLVTVPHANPKFSAFFFLNRLSKNISSGLISHIFADDFAKWSQRSLCHIKVSAKMQLLKLIWQMWATFKKKNRKGGRREEWKE